VTLGQDREVPAGTLMGSLAAVPPDPTLDAALIHLDAPVPSELAVPLRLSSTPAADLVGASAVMAGYGISGNATAGRRLFATRPVVSVESGLITIGAAGLGGACSGDSGGPALWRRGAPEVIGILRRGDPSCFGFDHYVDLAVLRPWLEQTVPLPSVATTAPCGEVPPAGACYNSDTLQQATWCEPDGLMWESCKDGMRCGWDRAQAHYACVLPEADPCAGVSQQGQCGEHSVLRCVGGQLRRENCACGSCSTTDSGVAVCTARLP
jgi:hypothetical protein